ncbi:CAP domain-containing protein [Streptomyces sp. NPDC006879]|uniref:CAP domain-containing protein n=1 Tax=Streptomyces sp. NPDC006879 TaxID=3364767 RepID=UPI00367D0E5C
MRSRLLKLPLALATLTALSCTTAASAPPEHRPAATQAPLVALPATDPQAVALMEAVNTYRARHQDTPSVTYDPGLATRAQAWAAQCTGRYESQGSVPAAQRVGQTMYSERYQDVADLTRRAVDLWYEEGATYDYVRQQSTTGAQTGHFTQVIWSKSVKVGAALVPCASGNLAGWNHLMVYWQDAGNVYGAYAANVHPLKPTS